MSLMRELQYAGDQIEKCGTASQIGNIPLSVKLKDKLKYHEEQIKKINTTLELLERNKDFEGLLFMLNEVH